MPYHLSTKKSVLFVILLWNLNLYCITFEIMSFDLLIFKSLEFNLLL